MDKEKNFYLAKNGLEYPILQDAETYGGGAVAIRKEIPASRQYVKLEGQEALDLPKPAPVVSVAPVDTAEDIYAQAKALGIKNPKIYKEDTLRAKIAEQLSA